MKKIKRNPSKQLLKKAIKIANKNHGGHYTLFAFTTNVAFSFGTINDRDEINNLPKFHDIDLAILNAIMNE